MSKKRRLLIGALSFVFFGDLFSKPLISIITSVYKGDLFIESFLEDVTRQTVFDKCELILINANSPGKEDVVIQRYLKKHPNIIYQKLKQDPGLYTVWNEAIKLSSGEFITNANIDDRLACNCYEMHAKALLENPEVALVYSDHYVTQKPNELFEHHSGRLHAYPEFSLENMIICLPGNNPMWRKVIHEIVGFFNEKYRSAGDWEMWLRMIRGGAIFKKVHGVYGLYYRNPKGISTAPASPQKSEIVEIYNTYKDYFKWKRAPV